LFVVATVFASVSFGEVVTIAGGVGAVGSTVCAIADVP
jgi:hypothetical protein